MAALWYNPSRMVLELVLAKNKFPSWKKLKGTGEAQGLRVLT